MSIRASQLADIFSTGEPWQRNGQQRFQLQLDSSLQVASNLLGVATGGITATHMGAGSVTPSSLAITSIDVPHSSASIVGTNVKTALEEVALGYLARVQKSGDTMSGDLDMTGNYLLNVGDPTAALDGVNLQSMSAAVSRGDFYFTPTTYGNPTGVNGTLKLTWIRASASAYYSGVPAPGDTVTVHGVIFTYVTTVTATGEVLIGPDVPTSVSNLVSAMNADTRVTLDLIPFNTNFWSVQDAGIGYALHVLCINEDPPNTPEDGNLKLAGEVSTVITVISFRGGLNTAKDSMVVVDAYTNTLYMFDEMQPTTPWIPIQGIGGPTNATLVTYTGPNLTNIPVTSPDNLQNILISIDTRFGAGGLPLHASRHEDAGVDEIDVGGLSGLLADAQTPLTHKASHEDTGLDEISVAGLSGLLADVQDAGWLHGNAVSANSPSTSDVLTWSGSNWAPQAIGALASPVILSGLSGTGLAVGEAVYVSANDTVSKAKADSTSTMPGVGVVSKTSPLEITVVGKVTGLTSIVAGSVYYISQTTPGVLTVTPPIASTHVIQSVALGLNATTIVVLPIQFTVIT